MKKKYIIPSIFIIIAFFCLAYVINAMMAPSSTKVDEDTIATEYISIETEPLYFQKDVFYIPRNTSVDCQNQILLCQVYIEKLKTLELVDNEIITNEIQRIEDIIDIYSHDLSKLLAQEAAENAKWEQRMEEYPIATTIWLYMRDTLEWNEYVCAGIMGNMMAECGGQTLNLNPNSKNQFSGCYGICQWHPNFFPQIQGATLEEQLKFLGETIEKTYNGWSGKEWNTSYEEFIALTDYNKVAKSFNNVYERPGFYSPQRGKNAQIAYEYFTQ